METYNIKFRTRLIKTTFEIRGLLQNNLLNVLCWWCCEIHKSYFVLKKLVLNARIKAFWYTKKSIRRNLLRLSLQRLLSQRKKKINYKV